MNRKELEEKITEILFSQPNKQPYVIYTGWGGCIEFATTWLKECGIENPSPERIKEEIERMIAHGWIRPLEGGGYQIS